MAATAALLGIFARTALVFGQARVPAFGWSWGGEIASVAKAISEGQGFASPYGGATGPTALVAPIYPYLLAGLLKIVPHLDVAARVAIYFNVIWSTLICFPLYAIGRQFGRRVGLLLFCAWAMLPLTGYSEATYFWQTSFYAFILTCLAAATLHLSSRSSTRAWIAYGIFGGFSLLCEPAHSIAWPVALAAVMWQRRLPWTRYALVGVVSALTVLPWVVRNSIVFHEPTYIRANLGWEIEEGLRTDPFDIGTARNTNPGRVAAQRAEYVAKGEARYLKDRSEQAWSVARLNVGALMRRSLLRAWIFWTGNIQISYLYWPAFHLVRLKYLFFALPGFAAFLSTLILCRSQSCRPLVLLGAVFLVIFPLPYYFTLTEPRYRAPIEPIVVALGLLGAWRVASAGLKPATDGEGARRSTARSSDDAPRPILPFTQVSLSLCTVAGENAGRHTAMYSAPPGSGVL